MIERLREFSKDVFPVSIFASGFVIIEWIFRLKSNGLLKTEEEWYSFGAFLMQTIPMLMAFLITIQFAFFFVFYFIEKLYKYIRG